MIKIAVFTTTRGDMAILSPLLLKMNKDKKIKPLLFVGGTHLNENFGKTVNEIKSNKLKIEGFFRYRNNQYDKPGLLKGLSEAHTSVSKIFEKKNLISCVS